VLLHVTACRLAKSPKATLYTGGFGIFVSSDIAPIATGWNEPVPGRDFRPAVDQCLITAHKTRNLLIFRDAQNVENGKIAPNWNVSGTWIFRPLAVFVAKQIAMVTANIDPIVESELAKRIYTVLALYRTSVFDKLHLFCHSYSRRSCEAE
jgi:hypothetical protein